MEEREQTLPLTFLFRTLEVFEFPLAKCKSWVLLCVRAATGNRHGPVILGNTAPEYPDKHDR